jgi:hypothetical protein
MPLHGEIWYNDRLDIIQKTAGTKTKSHPFWSMVKFIPFHIKPYHFFDGIERIPGFMNLSDYSQLTFENVKDALDKFNYTESGALMKNEYTWVNNLTEAIQICEAATSKGWEGMMFNSPRGSYELKRSYSVLKYKSCFEAEARIVDYAEADTDKKYSGQIGSLIVELTWDEKVLSIFGGMKHHVNKTLRFKVAGLYDEDRDYTTTQYKIGNQVKFSFFALSFDGVPQSANIYRGM